MTDGVSEALRELGSHGAHWENTPDLAVCLRPRAGTGAGGAAPVCAASLHRSSTVPGQCAVQRGCAAAVTAGHGERRWSLGRARPSCQVSPLPPLLRCASLFEVEQGARVGRGPAAADTDAPAALSRVTHCPLSWCRDAVLSTLTDGPETRPAAVKQRRPQRKTRVNCRYPGHQVFIECGIQSGISGHLPLPFGRRNIFKISLVPAPGFSSTHGGHTDPPPQQSMDT